MIALTQGGLYFRKIIADRLPYLEKRQDAVAREFVNRAKGEATICGCLFAGFLRSGETGSDSV